MRRAALVTRRPLNSRGIPAAVAAAAAVTPLTIFGANLLQWVRSDLGITIGTGVSAWADQSGNGKHYTQAVGAAQPSYSAIDATLNNRPSLTFDGVTQSLTSSLTLPAPGTTPTFIWLVLKQIVWGNFRPIVGNANDGAPRFRMKPLTATPSLTQSNAADVNPNTALAVGVWGRGELAYQNTVADWLKLIATKVSGGSAGNSAGDGVVTISGSGFANNCGIAEVFYASAIPTVPQLAALDAYCTSLYGAGLV